MGLQIPWAVFQIPKPRIPDSTSKMFLDSGFHNQKFLGFWNPYSLSWGDNLIPLFLFQRDNCLKLLRLNQNWIHLMRLNWNFQTFWVNRVHSLPPCSYKSFSCWFVLSFRDLYMKFSDIYIVRSRSAPVVIPETFAPKVRFSSTVLVPWIFIFKTTQKFKSSPGYAELQINVKESLISFWKKLGHKYV